MSKLRLSIVIVCVLVGILLAPTAGEFVVALVNRYSTYPAGTDTDMLANSMLVSLLFLLISFSPAFLLIYKRTSRLRWWALVGLFIILTLAWLFEPVSSFVPQEWCEYELKIYPCANEIWHSR